MTQGIPERPEVTEEIEKGKQSTEQPREDDLTPRELEANAAEEQRRKESAPPVTADTPLPKPVCPCCGKDPLTILARTFNAGRFKFLLPFCTECHKVVPAILLDVAEPRIQVAPGPIIHEN